MIIWRVSVCVCVSACTHARVCVGPVDTPSDSVWVTSWYILFLLILPLVPPTPSNFNPSHSPLHPQAVTHFAGILWQPNDHTTIRSPLSAPFSSSLSHRQTHTHTLATHNWPMLIPWLSQPLSRAQALLGKRSQASPNRMLMMSLTSGLRVGGESGSERQRSRHSFAHSLCITNAGPWQNSL